MDAGGSGVLGWARGVVAVAVLAGALLLPRFAVAQYRVDVQVTNDWPAYVVVVKEEGDDKDAGFGIEGRFEESGIATKHTLPLELGKDYEVFEGWNPRLGMSAHSGKQARPLFKFRAQANQPVTIPGFQVLLSNQADADVDFQLGSSSIVSVAAGETVEVPVTTNGLHIGSQFAVMRLRNDLSCYRLYEVHAGRNVLQFDTRTCRGTFSVQQTVRYDRQTYLMAHNTAENWAEGWWYAQQNRSIYDQLAIEGARAVELDVMLWSNFVLAPKDYYLCHAGCKRSVGATFGTGLKTVENAFAQIKSFLDAYPTEVVTIFIEFGDTYNEDPARVGRDLLDRMRWTGLLQYVYWPDGPSTGEYNACLRAWVDRNKGAIKPSALSHDVSNNLHNTSSTQHTWPMVQEMVQQNNRVIVFIDQGGANNEYCLPYTWNYVRENLWGGILSSGDPTATSPTPTPTSTAAPPTMKPTGTEQLETTAMLRMDQLLQERPQSKGLSRRTRTLFRFNNFPSRSNVDYQIVNSADFVLTRLQNWKSQAMLPGADDPLYGIGVPNFLALDFIEIGDAASIVQKMNDCRRQRPDGKCIYLAPPAPTNMKVQ